MLAEELQRRIDRLTQVASSHLAQNDRSVDLHDDVARTLKDLGLLKLWVPQQYGGLELDLPQTLRVYEAVASIDGSLGWAVMIGCGGGLFAAYLEPSAASQFFGKQDAVVAGSGAPNGRAERVEGGYRATGRWRYASGARYASVFTANCVITNQGEPELDSAGKPVIRAMSFAPADVTVIPTWDATGMRATGSHDFEVRDVFVPQAHTFSVFTDAPREAGPLYRLPFDVLTHLPVAAVASGIARLALRSFAELAVHKRAARHEAALADHEIARRDYAECHARCLGVHLALHALASRTWNTLISRGPPTSAELAEIAACSTWFVRQLQEAVSTLVADAGMNGVLNDSPLARAARDLQTLAAHSSVSPMLFAPAGATLLRMQR